MTENKPIEGKKDESISRKDAREIIEGKQDYLPVRTSGGLSGFDVEYAPHKSQGLQGPSDMWIDKSRLLEPISGDEKTFELVKKLARL